MCRRALSILLAIATALATATCSGDLRVTTSSLPDGTVGMAYSAQLMGEDVDRWALLSGNLPPGVSLNPDGDIRGTPALAGVFPFTIQAMHQPSSAPTQTVALGLSITVR
jgi:hypothetical protein